jgi:hypothetical protein
MTAEQVVAAIAEAIATIKAQEDELALLRRCVADSDVMADYCCDSETCKADWCVAYRAWRAKYGGNP